MDQIGEIWASLLELISNENEEEALNELMRLSNTSSRLENFPDQQIVALELEKEGENRLIKSITDKITAISKQNQTRARNGDLSKYDEDIYSILHLLRIRIGIDLISKSSSGRTTTIDCRQPFKQMMQINLTVRCSQTRDELRKRVDLKRKGKTIIPSPEDGFLEAIESCVNYVLQASKICIDSDQTLIDSEYNPDFFPLLIKSFHEIGSAQVKQMMNWYLEDRKINTNWMKRAEELGGLTFPRALASTSDQGKSENNNVAIIKPIDEFESSLLDLILHELSQILSLCYELRKDDHENDGLLQDVAFEFSSVMVKLDELWLTHNITKAVNHAITIQIEPPICVNSIVEDTFHVVGNCFARAVNSHSYFAAEPIANNVAGFLSDGFFEILKELVRRDSPIQNKKPQTGGGENSKASRAAANVVANNVEEIQYFHKTKVSHSFVEALNTLDTACPFLKDLKDEMTHSFDYSFGNKNAMAPSLLETPLKNMEALLTENVMMLAKCLLLNSAVKVITDALDPRGQPYQIGVAAFEREDIHKMSWVKDFVDIQFTSNIALRQCIPALTHSLAGKVLQQVAKFIAEIFEEKLTRLKFNALGAIQFGKDLRSLTEKMITECNSMTNKFQEEERFEDIRPVLKRLRHWQFLLNLERCSDEKVINFPGKALTEDEVKMVLHKRVEQDFFN